MGCFGWGRPLKADASKERSEGLTQAGTPQLEGAIMVYAANCAPCVESGRSRLSPIDHSAILSCVNPKALIYSYPMDPHVIRAALSVVLRDYPSLCGRLEAPGNTIKGVSGLHLIKARREQGVWVVNCNAGVPVRVVRAPQWTLATTFKTLNSMCRAGFSSGHRQACPDLPLWFEPIDLVEVLNGRAAPLSIRITSLGCGGTILAVTLSHALADGRSIGHFLQAWAAVHRRLAAAGPAPAPARAAQHHQQCSQERTKSAGDTDGVTVLGSRQLAWQPTFHQRNQLPEPPCNDRHLLMMGERSTAPTSRLHTAHAQSQPASNQHVTGTASTHTIRMSSYGAPPQLTRRVPLMPRPASDPRSTATTSGPTPHSSGTEPWPDVLGIQTRSYPTQVSPPSYLKLQALPQQQGWRAAIPAMLQALTAAKEEASQWQGLQDNLSTTIIHLPAETVAQLKVLGSLGQPHVSTNDCLTALVWVLVCDLRGRPLPGTAPPGSVNALGIAVDLRMNGLKGVLPQNLFANAIWAVHVPSARDAILTQPSRAVSVPTNRLPPIEAVHTLHVTPAQHKTPAVSPTAAQDALLVAAAAAGSALSQPEAAGPPATGTPAAPPLTVLAAPVAQAVKGRAVPSASASLGLRGRQMSEPPPVHLLTGLRPAPIRHPPLTTARPGAMLNPAHAVLRTLEDAWQQAQVASQHAQHVRTLQPSRQLSRSCSAAVGMLFRQGSEPSLGGALHVAGPVGESEVTDARAAALEDKWEVALRQGAARVRAVLLELRQHDQGEDGAPASSQLEAQGAQEGWKVMQHAADLSTAPLSAQLHVAARMLVGQDVMVTSQFAYWDVDFGQGGPSRTQSLLHPSPPWSAAIQAAHSDDGGHYLTLVTATTAVHQLVGSPVLKALAPGAKVHAALP